MWLDGFSVTVQHCSLLDNEPLKLLMSMHCIINSTSTWVLVIRFAVTLINRMCLAVAATSSHVLKSLTKLEWRQAGNTGLDISTMEVV